MPILETLCVRGIVLLSEQVTMLCIDKGIGEFCEVIAMVTKGPVWKKGE